MFMVNRWIILFNKTLYIYRNIYMRLHDYTRLISLAWLRLVFTSRIIILSLELYYSIPFHSTRSRSGSMGFEITGSRKSRKSHGQPPPPPPPPTSAELSWAFVFDVIGPRIDRRKDTRSCDDGRRGNERDPSRELGDDRREWVWVQRIRGGWEWNVESKMFRGILGEARGNEYRRERGERTSETSRASEVEKEKEGRGRKKVDGLEEEERKEERSV